MWGTRYGTRRTSDVELDEKGAVRVLEALLKRPDILYGVCNEMWEREISVAGPWERDLVSWTRYYPGVKVAAEVSRDDHDARWKWYVTVPNEDRGQERVEGYSQSLWGAAQAADEALTNKFNVLLATPDLPTEDM